jgi:hypothetical protein
MGKALLVSKIHKSNPFIILNVYSSIVVFFRTQNNSTSAKIKEKATEAIQAFMLGAPLFGALALT